MKKSLIAAVVVRFVFAALALAGVIAQLFGITVARDLGVVNFFSYFTILSNLIASVIFIISGVRLLTGRRSSETDVIIRGASTVYMVFVGVVFSALLQGADLGALIPWVNVVHHYVMPIVVILDWIIWPPQRKLPWRAIGLWMIFPVVYVIYSLVRGAVTDFYPYPFFDPTVQGGYGGVAVYCSVMVVGFIIISLVVRAIGNARARPLDA